MNVWIFELKDISSIFHVPFVSPFYLSFYPFHLGDEIASHWCAVHVPSGAPGQQGKQARGGPFFRFSQVALFVSPPRKSRFLDVWKVDWGSFWFFAFGILWLSSCSIAKRHSESSWKSSQSSHWGCDLRADGSDCPSLRAGLPRIGLGKHRQIIGQMTRNNHQLFLWDMTPKNLETSLDCHNNFFDHWCGNLMPTPIRHPWYPYL